MRLLTEAEIIALLEANEDAVAERMLRLLLTSWRRILRRIGETPADLAMAEVLVGMRVAVEDAIRRTSGQMTTTLASGRAQAIGLGVRLGEVNVPARFLATFSLNPRLVRAAAEHNAAQVTGITADFREQINQIVQVGFLSGETPRQVRDQLAQAGLQPAGPFRTVRNRADAIARTELAGIANTATYERGRDLAERIPGLKKRWRAATDSRTRPSHAAANGQTVGMEEAFSVGGYECQRPLDPALPAREVVRCRCRLALDPGEPPEE